MNSITYGIGYCLAILVVKVFSTDYHYTLMSENKVKTTAVPYNFGYKTNKSFLLMEITLKNISPSVTDVHLIYNQYYNPKSFCISGQKTVEVKKEENTSEIKFMILKHLKCYYIVVDVELYSQNRSCHRTNIAEGRDTTTLKKNSYNNIFYYTYTYQDERKYYHNTENCLAPSRCEIVVDLNNKCPEQRSSTDFNCYIDKSQYICTFNKPQDTSLIYTFYQTYDNRYLGPAQEMKEKVTKIFIELELFDNNTSVNVTSHVLRQTSNTMTLRDKKTILSSNKLSLTAKDISKDYSSVPKRNYSETKYVDYSCQRDGLNQKVHIGIIKTDNRLTTYNKTSINKTFTMAENGTILCCLYYTSNWADNGNDEFHIKRVVENRTILIHQPQESISTNPTESERQTKASPTAWLKYLAPTFLGICVLILALYIIKQKRICTNSQAPEETLELDNTATQNQVLYADLDLVRDENQPQGRNEEPHYATIAGVLHPLS